MESRERRKLVFFPIFLNVTTIMLHKSYRISWVCPPPRMLPANMEKMISKRNQQPELHNQLPQLRFQPLPQPWQRQRQHPHRCMHPHRRLSLLQHQLQWYNQRPVESLHQMPPE